MSFKCRNCGHIFDECDIHTYEESHGLDYGPFESVSCCPICKETGFQETTRCKICLGEFLEDELEYGVCEECVEDSITFDNCYEFAENFADSKESVEINWFLLSMFTASDIESILYNIAKGNTSYSELCKFLDLEECRMSEFAEFISKRKDGENNE